MFSNYHKQFWLNFQMCASGGCWYQQSRAVSILINWTELSNGSSHCMPPFLCLHPVFCHLYFVFCDVFSVFSDLYSVFSDLYSVIGLYCQMDCWYTRQICALVPNTPICKPEYTFHSTTLPYIFIPVFSCCEVQSVKRLLVDVGLREANLMNDHYYSLFLAPTGALIVTVVYYSI